jgi:hypothetical protein
MQKLELDKDTRRQHALAENDSREPGEPPYTRTKTGQTSRVFDGETARDGGNPTFLDQTLPNEQGLKKISRKAEYINR